MGNPLCHHVVVATLLVHRRRIAVAARQKPPAGVLAPSAGHLDPEDGLPVGCTAVPAEVLHLATVRELVEETGFPAAADRLIPLVQLTVDDPCHKPGAYGGPGGGHTWYVSAVEVETISEPSLRDEPGKMHGWTWRTPSSLLKDPKLEPVWRELLLAVLNTREGQHLFDV